MVRRFLFSHDWRFSVGVTYTRPLSSLVRPVMSKYEMIYMHNYILISVWFGSDTLFRCSDLLSCSGTGWMPPKHYNVQKVCHSG
jgi:hypothetical protein